MKSKYLKKLVSSLIFSGFGLFTLLFFAPVEVYLGNPTDFRFSLDAAVGVLAVTALLATVIFSLLASLLPVKVLKFVNLGILGVTLCYYIQFLLLNGEMITLDGNSLYLTRETKLINAFIWLGIFSAVFVAWFVFKKLGKEKLYITVTKYLAVALAIMQLTGFFSLFLTYDRSVNETKSLYFSSEGRLEVSEKNNVLYFIIDYCDGWIVDAALEEDPNLFSGLDGFTYYPDNVYTHARTFPAVPYLLTGEKYLNDIPFQSYIDNSFRDNRFLQKIDALGTDIRVYTEPLYVGEYALPYVDNYRSKDTNDLSDMKILQFVGETFKVSAFRGAPYAFKRFFAYNTDTVNFNSLVQDEDYAPVTNDPEFYNTIKTTKISVNENYDSAFRFYHMYGSHPGATFNENMEYEPNVSLPRALRGDLLIIKEYVRQLKELGVYDETTIIITADHGDYYGYFARPQTCLLLVKEAGADSSQPAKTSQAQVSHADLFATTLKAFGVEYASFGTPVSEVEEGVNRKRYHYNMEAIDGCEGILREYLIEGDGRDEANYTATRYWEVIYSLYQ